MSTLTGIPIAEGDPAHTSRTVRRCYGLADSRGVGGVRSPFVFNFYRCRYRCFYRYYCYYRFTRGIVWAKYSKTLVPRRRRR